MEQNSYTPNSEPLYESDALKVVDSYRQEINSILLDEDLNEGQKDHYLTQAAMKYHNKMDDFTESQQAFAWFALSSEDESLDFTRTAN